MMTLMPNNYKHWHETRKRFMHVLVMPRVYFLHLDVSSEVTLRPDEDERDEGGVSPDLWNPLLGNVLEGRGADDAKAQQEHICTRVTQRPQLVKLILRRSGRDHVTDIVESYQCWRVKQQFTSQHNYVFRSYLDEKQMICVLTILSHLVRLLVLLSDLFVMTEN